MGPRKQPEVDWEAVYETTLPRIYNYFLYRLNDWTLAEDLTSATFERAWISRHHYDRDIAGFSTWLFSIARRVAADHFRRSQPKIVPIDTVYDLAADQSPESEVIDRLDVETLGRVIAQLPEREQELIALKYGSEMTNRDIATLTGLTESNVGTILYRTLAHMRRLMTLEVKNG